MVRAEGSRERALRRTRGKESRGCGVNIRNWKRMGQEPAKGVHGALWKLAERSRCGAGNRESRCVRRLVLPGLLGTQKSVRVRVWTHEHTDDAGNTDALNNFPLS